MNELKKITNLVEEELIKFEINNEIDARYSNFNEDTDIQINDLIKIKKDKNFKIDILSSRGISQLIDICGKKIDFTHPYYDMDALENQINLREIQNKSNLLFSGSYFGYGFHEDGIQSSSYICKLLNCDLPWKREKNFYNRLQINFE